MVAWPRSSCSSSCCSPSWCWRASACAPACPYPVALVLGGLVIGLVPGLPSPRARSRRDLLRLPAAAAVRGGDRASPPHELRDNWAPIGLLAVGLVLVTIAAVAAVANAVLGIPWAAAFVLGAVLGPTDPVSAAAVLDRLGVTGRGEDDPPGRVAGQRRAPALTAYRIALAAVGGTAGSVADVGARVRRGRRRRHRDRPRRRLGLRPPAADRHRPVAGRRALGARRRSSPTSRPRRSARPGVLATVVAGLYVGSALARHHRAGHAPAHARVLGLDRVPARRPAVRADRRCRCRRSSTASTTPTLVTLSRLRAADRRGRDGRAVRCGCWSSRPCCTSKTSRAGADRDRVERDARRRLARGGAGHHRRGLPRARPRDLRRLRGDRAHARRPRADARAAGAAGSACRRARSTGARDAEARLRITQAALERLEELADEAPEHVVQRLRDRYGSRVERLEARIEGDHDEHGRTDAARRRAGCWRR